MEYFFVFEAIALSVGISSDGSYHATTTAALRVSSWWTQSWERIKHRAVWRQQAEALAYGSGDRARVEMLMRRFYATRRAAAWSQCGITGRSQTNNMCVYYRALCSLKPSENPSVNDCNPGWQIPRQLKYILHFDLTIWNNSFIFKKRMIKSCGCISCATH